jgi:hypothetical protein
LPSSRLPVLSFSSATTPLGAVEGAAAAAAAAAGFRAEPGPASRSQPRAIKAPETATIATAKSEELFNILIFLRVSFVSFAA